MAYQLGIPHGAFHTVTAPEHCAWPNLTLLPNGEIGAVIHNQPSHGGVEADVELWISGDAGDTWKLRSQVTNHEPGTTRMNVAAGLNQQGELVVLCSAWNLHHFNRKTVPEDVLEAVVCISSDDGHTWEQASVLEPPPGTVGFTPFGDVNSNGDELVVGGYTRDYQDGEMVATSAHMYHSLDGGRTWEYVSTIAAGDHNEVDLLVREPGPWLASVRIGDRARPRKDRRNNQPYIVLHTSEDEGRSWQEQSKVTHGNQHTSHLLQLADDRILLTYGSRMDELIGVIGRVSEDGGESWSQAFVLVSGLLNRDCGYPSDVQLENGDIVTAYYSKSSPWYQRYHMGVLRWNLEMVNPKMGPIWG